MSKFNFLRKAARFKQQIPSTLDRMANNAVYQFKIVNFDSKGFVDMTLNPWKPNKVQDGRQQLVKSGRMRESIRKLSGTFYSRLIGSDVPYAEYHNNGTDKLPQRKFIGESRKLSTKNARLLMDVIKKIV